MTPRFGTDGLRGVAGSELTPELTLALGRVAARELGIPGRPFLVGRDTRRSGPLLLAALGAGLAAEGVEVVDLGVLPTPGVAALAAMRGAPAAVISASHNPFPDNGIKLFAAGGIKLGDDAEGRIEAGLASAVAATDPPATPAPAAGAAPTTPGKVGSAIGWVGTDADGRRRYTEQLLASLGGRRLDGLRVALDLGNGAATATAADVIRASGADLVAVLGNAPDGTNINAGCGSTDPSGLAAAVVAEHADAGLAFDGDADRVIAVDAAGQIVDGDRVIALCALDLLGRGRLAGETVVVTVMTNLGFHLAMAERGIAVHQTPVGDRYVLEALDRGGWSLGGEQSGHVIFRDLATTGDGLLSGLQVLDVMARSGRTLADLAGSAMERLPQVLRNVKVTDRSALDDAAGVWDEVRAVEAQLGSDGRVLLRPSGTEPVIRVMVEARTEESASVAADRLVAAVIDGLGDGVAT
ncbi:MAG: phosphoglucosamine mutase [Acidimicrobiaceae bacterium]|nr:phosphoglucosamine mutase [Acidimicrobiaceae bacterium]